jgi:hypothetical protein
VSAVIIRNVAAVIVAMSVVAARSGIGKLSSLALSRSQDFGSSQDVIYSVYTSWQSHSKVCR